MCVQTSRPCAGTRPLKAPFKRVFSTPVGPFLNARDGPHSIRVQRIGPSALDCCQTGGQKPMAKQRDKPAQPAIVPWNGG